MEFDTEDQVLLYNALSFCDEKRNMKSMWQVPAIVPTYNIIRSPASLPPCLPQVEVLKSTGEGASHLSSLRPAQLPHNLSEDNWRERAAFQRSAFGRSTAGNDVVATIFIRLFFFFPFFFLRRDLFS